MWGCAASFKATSASASTAWLASSKWATTPVAPTSLSSCPASPCHPLSPPTPRSPRPYPRCPSQPPKRHPTATSNSPAEARTNVNPRAHPRSSSLLSRFRMTTRACPRRAAGPLPWPPSPRTRENATPSSGTSVPSAKTKSPFVSTISLSVVVTARSWCRYAHELTKDPNQGQMNGLKKRIKDKCDALIKEHAKKE